MQCFGVVSVVCYLVFIFVNTVTYFLVGAKAIEVLNSVRRCHTDRALLGVDGQCDDIDSVVLCDLEVHYLGPNAGLTCNIRASPLRLVTLKWSNYCITARLS